MEPLAPISRRKALGLVAAVSIPPTVAVGAAAARHVPSNESVPEHPWSAARRLSKELSAVLAEYDGGNWFAHVMPPAPMSLNGFGAYPMSQQNEAPVDRVNRLAWELAEALNDYAGGRFQARIYPSDQAGYAVMFAHTAACEREGRS